MAFARSLPLVVLSLALAGCGLRPVLPAEAAATPEPADHNPSIQVVARPVEIRRTAPVQSPPAKPALITAPFGKPAQPAVSQSVVVRAAPPEPKWSGVVLRLEFLFPEKHLRHSGTGFIVRDRAGDCYLLTCAHIVDKKDWESRHSVTMRFMNNEKVIYSMGPSLYVGTPVDLKHLKANGRPDLTRDFVIRSVVGNWARPLPLAKTDPKVGERVWAVGCEMAQPISDEKLFPGEVVEVAGGGYTFRKQVAFDPRGFSGGPVVNRQGQVVGNVLVGGGEFVSGATVGTIRQRLAEKKILVD